MIEYLLIADCYQLKVLELNFPKTRNPLNSYTSDSLIALASKNCKKKFDRFSKKITEKHIIFSYRDKYENYLIIVIEIEKKDEIDIFDLFKKIEKIFSKIDNENSLEIEKNIPKFDELIKKHNIMLTLPSIIKGFMKKNQEFMTLTGNQVEILDKLYSEKNILGGEMDTEELQKGREGGEGIKIGFLKADRALGNEKFINDGDIDKKLNNNGDNDKNGDNNNGDNNNNLQNEKEKENQAKNENLNNEEINQNFENTEKIVNSNNVFKIIKRNDMDKSDEYEDLEAPLHFSGSDDSDINKKKIIFEKKLFLGIGIFAFLAVLITGYYMTSD